MKVVDCPEGKFYVCVKMFGGGMGDQIRRYCEAIPREVTSIRTDFFILQGVPIVPTSSRQFAKWTGRVYDFPFDFGHFRFW